MTVRFGFYTTVLLLASGPVLGQTAPWRDSAPATQPAAGSRPAATPRSTPPVPAKAPQRRPAVGPDQPVYPQQVPTLKRRAPAPQPARAPFLLTPQQRTYLDWVLQAWEQQSSRVKTFECRFVRWEYDPVFGDADKPKTEDKGELKYAAPDRGSFEIKGDRPERWVCNGKSIFEYNYAKKQLIEHKLPPELQGKTISNGPLPFLFGAKAAELKERYFMRVVTPADRRDKGEIWLEAYPRHQQDAANFRRAELILKTKDMEPYALQVYDPGGKNHTAYRFYDVVVNDPLQQFFKINPFLAPTPPFWKKIVEEPPAPQVSRRPAAPTPR